jgi:hypothetical protein
MPRIKFSEKLTRRNYKKLRFVVPEQLVRKRLNVQLHSKKQRVQRDRCIKSISILIRLHVFVFSTNESKKVRARHHSEVGIHSMLIT